MGRWRDGARGRKRDYFRETGRKRVRQREEGVRQRDRDARENQRVKL